MPEKSFEGLDVKQGSQGVAMESRNSADGMIDMCLGGRDNSVTPGV